MNETLKHFLYVHGLSISFDYAHFELGLRNFDRSMRICYRNDIGSAQLILRETRTAFQGTDSPNISLFSHCDDQLTIFVNFSCYAHSKF